MTTLSISAAHTQDVISIAVRVAIVVSSVIIVYLGLARYHVSRDIVYLFAALLGVMWLVIYVASISIQGLFSPDAFFPEIVRPAILVTLTLVIIWLVKWCR